MALTISEARSIAAGWISPGPGSVNLTAFATGHPRWSFDGLIDEIQRELGDVVKNPQHFDDAAQCRRELRDLLHWAERRPDGAYVVSHNRWSN